MASGLWLTSGSPARRSEKGKRSKEIYAWKTLKKLRAELGEDLANDLYARHKEIDPRMKGKLLQPHPNFPKVEERGSRVCCGSYGGDQP